MICLTCGLTIGILGLASAAPVTRELASEILHKQGCQTELPLGERPQSPPEPSDRPTPARPSEGTSDGGSPRPEYPDPPPATTLLLIGLILVVVVAMAMRWPRGASGGDKLVPREIASAINARRPPASPLLEDAESLARQGRFGEAIHAVLLRWLADLARSGAIPARAPSLTSRELLRRETTLVAEARGALGSLVVAVERVHFGGRPAGLQEYEACAAQYRRFRQARTPRLQAARSEAGP